MITRLLTNIKRKILSPIARQRENIHQIKRRRWKPTADCCHETRADHAGLVDIASHGAAEGGVPDDAVGENEGGSVECLVGEIAACEFYLGLIANAVIFIVIIVVDIVVIIIVVVIPPPGTLSNVIVPKSHRQHVPSLAVLHPAA